MSRDRSLQNIQFDFTVDNLPTGIHPTEGLPMLFTDQLNIIAKNISEITTENRWHTTTSPSNIAPNDPPDLIPVCDDDSDSDNDDSDDEEDNEIATEEAEQTTADTTSPTQTPQPQSEPITSAAITATLKKLFVEAQPPVIRRLFDPSIDMPQERIDPAPNIDPAGQKFTQKQVQNSPEAAQWHQMEFKQLDMYEEQNTFGPPEPRRPGMNVWKLLWTYVQKPPPDNRLKAHAVCDGSKRGRRMRR
jgi:hypothetical protein